MTATHLSQFLTIIRKELRLEAKEGDNTQYSCTPCFKKTEYIKIQPNKSRNLGSDFFMLKVKVFIVLEELLYD